MRKLLIQFRIGEICLMLGFAVIGIVYSSTVPSLRVLYFVAAMFLLFSSIYSWNSWLGYVDDVDNPRLILGSRKSYGIFALLTSLCALALLTKISFYLMLVGAFDLLLWIGYSKSRIGFKSIPVLGTVTHFVSQVLHFLMASYTVSQSVSVSSILIGLYFAGLFAAGHLNHELIDYHADRNQGLKTSAVMWGRQRVFWAMVSIFIFANGWYFALYFSEVISFSQFLPFAVAFCLQILVMLLFASKKMMDLFTFKRWYRLFYFIAGCWVTIFWVREMIALIWG